MEQDSETKGALEVQSDKLKKLINLHQQCLLQEKNMRSKQLALMRERNLYLVKLRQIETLGEQKEWKAPGEDGQILEEVHKVLYDNNSSIL